MLERQLDKITVRFGISKVFSCGKIVKKKKKDGKEKILLRAYNFRWIGGIDCG